MFAEMAFNEVTDILGPPAAENVVTYPSLDENDPGQPLFW